MLSGLIGWRVATRPALSDSRLTRGAGALFLSY